MTTTGPPGFTQQRSRDAFGISRIIDGHNDLPWASRTTAGYTVEGLDVPSDRFDTDIPRLRQGGVGAQFWSVYSPDDLDPGDAVQYTLEQIDFVHRLVGRYPDDLVLARTGDDVRAAWDRGQIASLLGAEGGHSIGGSLGVLRVFAHLGLKYMTLTHNHNVAWADSATDQPVHGGLTRFGRRVVTEMNTLGVIPDLSHVSSDTMRDAIRTTSAPIIFSHSSCAALCDHPRNVADDVLASLQVNGGVVMIAFVPSFVSHRYREWFDAGQSGPKPRVTVADVADHVEHAREVAGLEHVGIGSDYDGFEDFPEEMTDVTGFAPLIDCLATRGWSAAELGGLMGGNILRVLDDTPRGPVLPA